MDYARAAQLRMRNASLCRLTMDMGLMGVIATQLWHHTFCGGGLADLPTWTPPVLADTQLYQTPLTFPHLDVVPAIESLTVSQT